VPHDFDARHWDEHWQHALSRETEPIPYLVRETAHLSPTVGLLPCTTSSYPRRVAVFPTRREPRVEAGKDS
jgi:hypothetical protein